MRLPGKLWLKDTFAGIEWQHRIVDQKTLSRKADGVSCYAVSVEGDRAVYYLEGQSYETLRLLAIHEAHHRPSMCPGEVHTLHQIYGEENYDEREESAATYYARVLVEILGPYLRLPKPPK